MHPTQWSRGTAVGGPAYPTPYQETGAPPRAFAMRPPFAGHGGQLLNWSLATTTKKYFIQRNQYIFALPWHEEEPAPAQTSRAPPCLPHGLSTEGIGSQATMSARMKSLFWEYLGQSLVLLQNQYFLPKPTTKTASAPNFISRHIPSPPTCRAEKGHAGTFQTFSL